MAENMHQLQKELAQSTKNARLSSAVDDVDKMIALLTEARERVASGTCGQTSATGHFEASSALTTMVLRSVRSARRQSHHDQASEPDTRGL